MGPQNIHPHPPPMENAFWPQMGGGGGAYIISPRRFACPVWSPELPLPSHCARGKMSLVPRNLGILFLGTLLGTLRKSSFWATPINFVPRNFWELLLSAVRGNANKFCSQELFGIVPRNFSKCSQEQFPMSCGV